MRITMIEPSGHGGLVHFAYELCQALAEEGHQVRLITACDYELASLSHRFEVCPSMRLWPKVSRGKSEPSKSLAAKMKRGARRIWRGAKLTYELARVTRGVISDRPDAVLFSVISYPHLFVAPLIISKAGIKTAQICHEFDVRDYELSWVQNLALRASQRCYKHFFRIFFLSEATRQDFLDTVGFASEATRRIPHGSQNFFPRESKHSANKLRQQFGLGKNEPILLYFGYIRPSKGLNELIEAFAATHSCKSARLIIAGYVTKLADIGEIRQTADRLRVTDRVIFETSYIPNEEVAAYFELARAVVLPYRSASQSGVLHLAYGYGKPVVATAVGGLKEDVFEKKTGFLVPAGDISALSVALEKMVVDLESAERMGRCARELSQTQFTWPAAAKIIIEALSPTCGDGYAGKSGRVCEHANSDLKHCPLPDAASSGNAPR
ncbi:MAG: glycosyltransferase family 4 protein [Hyphomicrobiaceae bacterium]